MSDLDALYAVLSDAEIMQHYPYTFDEERVRSWIERNMDRYKNDGFGLWAVCRKDSGAVIGDCGMTMQMIGWERLPEIGWHIRSDQQRRGYAKEAAKAVLQWALQHTDFPAYYSYCRYTNTASRKTAAAIGMQFDREYPDAVNGITYVSVIRRTDVNGSGKEYGMDIDVYQQYFAAEGCFSGVKRRGVSVMLTSSSGGGEIRYTLTATFFPFENPEDFSITYDAAFSKVLYEGKGRRSRKREQSMLETLRGQADILAAEQHAEIFWDKPLNEAQYG